jgi:signal transduction histidine kinase
VPRWTITSREHYDPPVVRDASKPARHVRPTATIRGVLIVGFAMVFGLWVLSGYELVRRLHTLEQRTAAEQQATLRGERLLSTVRTNVLLGSIYLRDALIDNASMNVDYYRTELNDIRNEVEAVLPNYVVEVTSPEERQHWEQLQNELNEYWKSRELVFAPSAPLNTSQAASVLRRRVVPSRTTILQIIDRLSELQALSQQRHEVEISILYEELRNRLLLIGAAAIIIGIVVAMFATRQVGALQRRIEDQQVAERQTRQELERLSARLVNVQEQERRSLARELHDEVGQALTAIKMDVSVALRGVEQDARVVSSLEDARSIAENTLQGVRDLSQLLHPSMLDDFGLPETLRSYLRSYAKRTGIRTQFNEHGMEQRLPADAEVCMYRIAQEALTNVARHSGARNVVVTVSRTDAGIHMTVEDDGRGVDGRMIRSHAAHGLGLIGMRERAQALGGTFSIEPRQSGGTRVAVHLPALPSTADLPDSQPPELLAG